MRAHRVFAVAVVSVTALVCLTEPAVAPPPTVSAAWLAENLKTPGLVILDARGSLRDHLAGHIPGAQPLMVENVRTASGGVPGEIVPVEVISVLAGRLGIDSSSHVVVYGAEDDPDATFVATALRQAGLAGVSVLEGGLKRWQAEQRPVATDRPTVSRARPQLEGTPTGLAPLDEVRRAVETKSAILLDARPPEQYEAGRLPGAVSRFWKNDLAPEGTPEAGLLRGTADLERAYAALGVTKDRPVIVYCNTGHMASHTFYTLRYRLGYPLVKLYDGSWVEWSSIEGLPREKGPAAPK